MTPEREAEIRRVLERTAHDGEAGYAGAARDLLAALDAQDVELAHRRAQVSTAQDRLTAWRYASRDCPACHAPIHTADCVLVVVLAALAEPQP